MIGYAVCTGQPEDGSNTLQTDQSFGLAFDLGSVLRYHITNNISMLVNVDYYSTKLKFEITTMWPGADEQPIKALSVGLGLAYRLR